MTRKKQGLGVIGICLIAALSLMAFAGSAQAKGTWKSGGATITSGTIVSEEDSKEFVLLSKSGTTAIEILCETLTLSEGKLEAEGKGSGELKFSKNCRFLAKGVVQASCKPVEPIVAKVKLLLFKHLADGKTYALASPLDGTLKFTTLKLGAECAFGENIEVSGHVVLEDCAGIFSTEAAKHLIQQSASTTLFTAAGFTNALKYGANAATLDGSTWLKLSTGANWSGVGISED